MFRKMYLTRAAAEDAAAKYAEILNAKSGRLTTIDSDEEYEMSEEFALCVDSWIEASAVAVDKGADTIALFGWKYENEEAYVSEFLERQDPDCKYTVTKVEWHGVNDNTYVFAVFSWRGEGYGNGGMSAALINPRRRACWVLDDWQLPICPIYVDECENYSWTDLENHESVSGDEILAKATER